VKTFLSGVASLILLIALIVAAAFGGRWALSWFFDGVDSTISAAIVAAAATTIVSVLGVTLGRYFERRDRIEVELRQRKTVIYMEFVEGLMAMFLNGSENPNPQPRGRGSREPEFDLVAFFTKMTPQLMIWASNDVVSNWSQFRRVGENAPPSKSMFRLESLLLAIRKDLGHSGEMPKGDLLGTFINDIDDVLAEIASQR